MVLLFITQGVEKSILFAIIYKKLMINDLIRNENKNSKKHTIVLIILES